MFKPGLSQSGPPAISEPRTAERLAFVLHDVFGIEFEEIGSIVSRSTLPARQLASRALRRVRTTAPDPDASLTDQRKVVDAFLAASRAGSFEALLDVLDPNTVMRTDRNQAGAFVPTAIVGAQAVARQVLHRGTRLAHLARPVVVNGAAGAMVGPPERPLAIVGFTVVHGRITAIDLTTNPAHMHLDPPPAP